MRAWRPEGHRAALRAAAGGALALLVVGATECSYRGHVFGGTGSGTTNETAIGPISRFGSIVTGGVEYATGTASLAMDGAGAFESELAVGQVASIVGTVASGRATGTAKRVSVEDKLVGPIAAVSLASGTLTVLGQTVRLNGDTSVGAGIVPGDAAGFSVGDVVVVDGLRSATGLIATRLDRAASGRAYRVVGRVAGMRAYSQSFTLGGTTVDFSGLGTLPAGIADGSYVAVTGTAPPLSATLQATLVESKTESSPGANGDGGDVYGAVTRYAAADDFDVAGQPVTVNSTTTYPHGTNALKADAVVEASGQYDHSGHLVATTLEVRPEPTVRIVAAVDALDPVAATLTLAGVTVSTEARTRWDDRRSALRAFGYTALASGDWLEVRGHGAASGRAATAEVIERRAAPATPGIELQDRASGVNEPEFALVGVTVDARSAYFLDALGQSLSRAAFFAQAAGRLVRAHGALSGSTLTADRVALRD
jgi:hypothetical protein